MDMLENKIRVKKLRLNLKQLNDEDPDSDYERDDNLLTRELSTINNKLAKATQSRGNDHLINATTVESVSR